jgi:hypothetical protein
LRCGRSCSDSPACRLPAASSRSFYAFSAAYERGWVWLIVVGVIATAVSLYYYFAVIRAMYMRPAAELQLAPSGRSPPPERLVQAAVAGALASHRGHLLRGTAADRHRQGRGFVAVVPVLRPKPTSGLRRDMATSSTIPSVQRTSRHAIRTVEPT